MTPATLGFPRTDPTPIFDAFRGNYSTELLTAAVTHFKLFERLKDGPRSFEALRAECGLGERGALVLVTAMRALRLLTRKANGELELSEQAREHLILDASFDVSGYIGLAADSAGVKEMIERLCTNTPAGAKDKSKGAAFIYREGIESAMESEASARHLTMMLAGRARNCAPALAHGVPLGEARQLLDVGGGTGIYSIALLQKNPQLRAVVWDRPEVLKIAAQMARDYGVSDRLECRVGDMFIDPFPVNCDVILLSNVLHDWDVPQCRALLKHCAAALPSGGRVLIHDVYLNDELDGPLPVALYSGALFYLTEGRAYSGAEYRGWLREVGLTPGTIVPTLVHCGVLPATK